MTRQKINEWIVDDYRDWLYNIVAGKVRSKLVTYRKLLDALYGVEFEPILKDDVNREQDGISLRWRYICERGKRSIADRVMECIGGPCSILEMMVALALRCEETIMEDPLVGNRTSQWFWNMVTSLGLGAMSNNCFDEERVYDILQKFNRREYSPDGRGGLFVVRNTSEDLRDVDIWSQLCWYLDNIT